MHNSTPTKSATHFGTPRLGSLLRLLCGAVLLQAAAGGCQEALSSAVDAMGQPVATGIGNALSSLVQALIIGALI